MSDNMSMADESASMGHEQMSTDEMGTIALTGNAEVDFFSAMIPHHASAISLSEQLRRKITDPQLRDLATSIIQSQKAEMFYMQKWIEAFPASPEDKANIANSENMLAESITVMEQMRTIEMTDDANKDFVLSMTPHHVAAVKMAQAILPYLKNSQTINFTKNIISVQSNEIEQMQIWLDQAHTM